MIAPAGHHCNVRSGHLNATFGGKDMGSMAQTGLLLVPSDALGHTWALPGVLGAGQGLPPESGPEGLNMTEEKTSTCCVLCVVVVCGVRGVCVLCIVCCVLCGLEITSRLVQGWATASAPHPSP